MYKGQILYIDDNIQAGRLTKLYLEKNKFKVFLAGDTTAARDILAAEKINVLITDIGLPGEDGLQFYKWLQNIEPYKKIPVLLVSAHAVGFDDILRDHRDIFIAKPVFFPELISRLEKICKDCKQDI